MKEHRTVSMQAHRQNHHDGPARATRRLLQATMALGVCATLISCAAWEPDLGPEMMSGCAMKDSDPTTEVHFKADVYDPIIMPFCLPCHDPKGAAPVGFTNAGLDMTSLAGLRIGGKDLGASIVISGDPCRSHFYAKVVGAGQRGSRMPLGGPRLSEKQLQVIHDWIAEGARDN